MYASTHINFLHNEIEKEKKMLFNQQGKQVTFPSNKELSDHAKRSVTEKLYPAPYKGHTFFRLEERANIIK